MHRTGQSTQLSATVHCNTPLDWNLGIQHSVALLCTQLRNVGGRAIDCMVTRHWLRTKACVSSPRMDKGFHPNLTRTKDCDFKISVLKDLFVGNYQNLIKTSEYE